MKPFEEIKQEILSRAKKANACESEYRKAYESRTSEELIKDNINWVLKYMHISSEYLEETFGTELLFKNHIYTRGCHDISITADSANIVCLGNSSVDINVWDNSFHKIIVFDNSFVRVHTYNKSIVKIDSGCKSVVHIKNYGGSTVRVSSFDESSVDVEAYSSALTHINAHRNSSINVNAFKSSIVKCFSFGNSSLNVDTYNRSLVDLYIYTKPSNVTFNVKGKYSLIRYMNKNEVHIKKYILNIVEHETE